MADSLDAFCQDCRAALTSHTRPGGREAVRPQSGALLAEPAFLDRTSGRRRPPAYA